MKPEEQRIAIAKACGWKLRWQNMGGGALFDAKPKGHCWEIWTPPTPRFSRDPDSIIGPPDYLNDLNAMHEAEKVLYAKGWDVADRYLERLHALAQRPHICTISHMVAYVSATATQRAEAFLRTLNLYTP